MKSGAELNAVRRREAEGAPEPAEDEPARKRRTGRASASHPAATGCPRSLADPNNDSKDAATPERGHNQAFDRPLAGRTGRQDR